MEKYITQDDVIYFIITDRFFGKHKRYVDPADTSIHGGTLDGILEKLDYLKELGVTAIWVTPVYENVKEHAGIQPYHYYWPSDFERIDGRLLDGTHLPEEREIGTFAKFVEACEDKGIKVILDMIVNHVGYGAKENFDASWFNSNGTGEVKGELAGLPDFNHDNPNVIDYFINNIRTWVTQGKVTNIRMDTVKHVEQKFWYYFKSEIRGEFPELFLLGEVLAQEKEQIMDLLKYQNYHDFDSVFDFPLCTALRSTLIYDESIKNWLARPGLSDDEPLGVLDDDDPFNREYRNENKLVTLLDNHDLERRIMSHATYKHGGAKGLHMAIQVMKLCLGALFTMRGIPHLYYGTEVGLEGWKSEENGEISRDYLMRKDFPWTIIGHDHHPKRAFPTESEIYEWTRDLIQLRKNRPALKYGATITLWSDDLVLAFVRIASDDVVLVVINNGYEKMADPIQLSLDPGLISQRVIDVITHDLRHWKTGKALDVVDGKVFVAAQGKTIDIYCSEKRRKSR